ncbi:MAG: phage holin family protein [Nocardioides sp.]
MRIVSWLVTNAIALAVAAWAIDGIFFDGPTEGSAELGEKLLPLLAVALILGLVSVFVEPVVKFLSLPFIVLTIGLFLLVINALMLMLTGWIAGRAGVGFEVTGFWPALLGSIIITVVTGFIDLVAIDDD